MFMIISWVLKNNVNSVVAHFSVLHAFNGYIVYHVVHTYSILSDIIVFMIQQLAGEICNNFLL